MRSALVDGTAPTVPPPLWQAGAPSRARSARNGDDRGRRRGAEFGESSCRRVDRS
ncbi:hypothetical protein Y09_0583 [Brachybacterium sp. SW0106-09]|nr:hypothetical protein Y09_0583 [Brachybacterium sp. SW0106-09]